MSGRNDLQIRLFLKPGMTHYFKENWLRAGVHWALRNRWTDTGRPFPAKCVPSLFMSGPGHVKPNIAVRVAVSFIRGL